MWGPVRQPEHNLINMHVNDTLASPATRETLPPKYFDMFNFRELLPEAPEPPPWTAGYPRAPALGHRPSPGTREAPASATEEEQAALKMRDAHQMAVMGAMRLGVTPQGARRA